jgi:uncharacterized membrane protein
MDEWNAKPGLPVVLDPPGEPYSEHLQTTMRTGCPTVVGWPWHLVQRRRSPIEITRRRVDVEWMTTSDNLAFREALRKSYGIEGGR